MVETRRSLTEEERVFFTNEFNRYDKDKSGKIHLDEFLSTMREKKILPFFLLLDSNKDGFIADDEVNTFSELIVELKNALELKAKQTTPTTPTTSPTISFAEFASITSAHRPIDTNNINV